MYFGPFPIIASMKSNPSLCNHQVCEPTFIVAANVCSSPGTSVIPHFTPASFSLLR